MRLDGSGSSKNARVGDVRIAAIAQVLGRRGRSSASGVTSQAVMERRLARLSATRLGAGRKVIDGRSILRE